MGHPLRDFTQKATLAAGLHIDIKTHSVCDPREVDPWNYAEDWSTGVWVVAYAIGDGQINVWHPGDPVPDEVTQAIASGLPIISYDAPFKRALFPNIMGPRYGWPIPPLEQWVCTAAMAAAMGLPPGGVDEAARVMGIDERKDEECHALILRMSRPRTKISVPCALCHTLKCDHHEMLNTKLVWWTDAEDRARLDRCCMQDVRTERALCGVLQPLSQSERETWLSDQATNDRSEALNLLLAGCNPSNASGPAVTTNVTPQGAPEIDPIWIRAHVELIHSLAKSFDGQGTIVATGFGEDPNEIDPKTGKLGRALPPKVIHAPIGGIKETLEGLVRFVKRPHYNVYMPLAIFRPDLNSWSKGYERDVVGCLGIVADFDDPDASRWAERLPLPPNYVLETSSGRFQAFYLFDKPEPLEAVKPVAERLKAFARCDHGTSDISHVWRVPGALNWPNAKKVAEGRPPDPQLVRAVAYNHNRDRTSLQALSDALPKGEPTAAANKTIPSSSAPRPRCLEAALEYLNLGFSVIPLYGFDERGICTCGKVACHRAGKHPISGWTKSRNKRQTPEQLIEAFNRHPDANVGIITGSVSGIVVVDVEGPEGLDALSKLVENDSPAFPTVKTGRGHHLYARHPGGALNGFIKIPGGLDFPDDGAYVVAPPSRHESGQEYTWTRGLTPSLPDLPPGLLNLLGSSNAQSNPTPARGAKSTGETSHRKASEGRPHSRHPASVEGSPENLDALARMRSNDLSHVVIAARQSSG